MKLKEWIALWQEVYDKPAVRPSTYQAHGYLLKNHIVPRLGEMELTSLTETTVRRFLKDCHDHGNLRRNEPLSQETMRHICVLLSGILNQAVMRESAHLKRVFQLVDVRHAPTEDDQLMVEYLRHYDIPFTVVATKADKLSKAQRGRSIPVICRTLGVQPWEVMVHSSKDGTGKDRLLALIEAEIMPAVENEST